MITKKKKVSVKEYSAGEIRKVAMNILKHEYGAEVWMNNNLAVRGRKFIGRKGVADIIGYTKDRGVMVMCEIKTLNDTFSDEQIELLNDLQRCGGVALVAYQDGIKIEVKPFIQIQKLAA
ncbi:MAG TPA: hypothetical protein VF622_04710 [Segetibacter sp.]|jgi:hypothetical protein